MTRIELTEHRTTRSVELRPEEVLTLRRMVPSLTLVSSFSARGTWDLTPGSDVGVITIGDREISIRPKVSIRRLMFLLSYSADQVRWHDGEVAYGDEPDLDDLLLAAYSRALQQALGRGVLRGYRTEESALFTVRGHIDFNEQLRRRFGRMPPIAVRFDEYDENIAANQLLKAALTRCRHLQLGAPGIGQCLRRFEFALAEVGLVDFDPRRLPDVAYNRLNEHYRLAVELAKLILRSLTIEQNPGRSRASAFLVNMNKAFEDFVVIALRESLGAGKGAFPQGAKGRPIHLDEGGVINLKPDISWWDGTTCRFVGDVKYKRIKAEGILHPDLYQLLAYTVALDLHEGLLIYAKGEAAEVEHVVNFAGKRLHVHAIDVSGAPDEVLADVAHLATIVRRLRVRAGGGPD